MLVDAVEWLGHSGFKVRAGRATIYIDPYRVGKAPRADLILITHGHYDHFSPQAAEAARRIQPQVAVPMHWGEHIGTREDAEAFAARLAGEPVEARIMEKASYQ